VISFDGIVCVSLHDMARRRQQLLEHTRIGRRAIGAHLCGAGAVVEGTGKEPASGRQISSVGYQDIDGLAILVDRPIQIPPPPGDFHIRLIHIPAISCGMPTRPGHIDQQRSKPLHPPIDRDMVSTAMPRSANNSSTSR
jgi:hypothetical protein